jgi:hypothetical protein
MHGHRRAPLCASAKQRRERDGLVGQDARPAEVIQPSAGSWELASRKMLNYLRNARPISKTRNHTIRC